MDARKARRRWWLLVALLLVGALVIWRFAAAQTLVARAREIQVGQSRSDVVALIGEPHMSYNAGVVNGECYSSRPKVELLARVLLHNFCDLDVIPSATAMDVEVRYDDQQRVKWVRAGKDRAPMH